MNPSPRLHGKHLSNPGCGHTAMHSRAVSFWQSRMCLAGKPAAPPALADLRSLAGQIHRDRAISA